MDVMRAPRPTLRVAAFRQPEDLTGIAIQIRKRPLPVLVSPSYAVIGVIEIVTMAVHPYLLRLSQAMASTDPAHSSLGELKGNEVEKLLVEGFV